MKGPSGGGGGRGAPHPHDDDSDEEAHELFERTYAAFAYANMCLDRGYSMSNSVRLAPAMGVDPALVPAAYKRVLASRLKDGRGVGNAGVVAAGGRKAAGAAVPLTPSQSALLAAVRAGDADASAQLEALRRAVDVGGLALGAYLQRVAPGVTLGTDAVRGRKLVAAAAYAPGDVVLTDLSALHGVASTLAAGPEAYVPAAEAGRLDYGGHLDGSEAEAAAGGSPAAAALALVLQLNRGPLAPSAAAAAGEGAAAAQPPLPPQPTFTSLSEALHAVFADNQFQGCGFLPPPAEPQSAAQAAESGGPDARRLTAVFPAVSLINHDCAPNARFSSRYDPGRRAVEARVVAERPIAPGDEVTIAYIDTSAPVEERRARTAGAFGFACACARCAAPNDDAVALKCPACKTGTLVGSASVGGACSNSSSSGGGGACAAPPLPPAKMAALLGLRGRMVEDAKREALVGRIGGDVPRMARSLASLGRLLHDADTAAFAALQATLEAATGPAAQGVAAAAAARRDGKGGSEAAPFSDRPPATPAQLYEWTRRLHDALGRVGHLQSPLTIAALHDEVALYYCYAGAEGGPDVRERAAAAFAAAADGIAQLERGGGGGGSGGGGGMDEYVALLRRLAADPPLGPEAAAAAKAAQLALAARERNYLG